MKTKGFPGRWWIKWENLGYLGIQAPRELGGAGMDAVSYIIIIEEISRAAAALGLLASVHNSVALYPILAFGNAFHHEKFVPDLATGKKIGAFCLTEPNAGSDASAIEATAIRDGGHYIVNANKVFVTNGGVADICVMFVQNRSCCRSPGHQRHCGGKRNPGICGGRKGKFVRHAGQPG